MKRTDFLKIKPFYFYHCTEAMQLTFHAMMYDILSGSGLENNPDLNELLVLYHQKITEKESIPAGYSLLEANNGIVEIGQQASDAFRSILHILTNVKNSADRTLVALYPKLEEEILRPFPFSTIRKPVDTRFQLYLLLTERLLNHWQPLLETCRLEADVKLLQETSNQYMVQSTQRSIEASKKEKGINKRLLSELRNLYSVLMAYVEAWANTPPSVQKNSERNKKARKVIPQCNQLITENRKSMAISASNRKRRK